MRTTSIQGEYGTSGEDGQIPKLGTRVRFPASAFVFYPSGVRFAAPELATGRGRPRKQTAYSFIVDAPLFRECMNIRWNRSKSGHWLWNPCDGQVDTLHRWVWLQCYGILPPEPLTIDHINRNPDDNRIANLRPATVELQRLNSGKHRHGDPDLPRGVSREKGRFFARLSGKRLGTFSTAEEASEVFQSALHEAISSEVTKAESLWLEQIGGVA